MSSISLKKYKGFRRLYPNLRMSWSLFMKWLRNDWRGIWRYLTEKEEPATKQMRRGKFVHEILEGSDLVDELLPLVGINAKRYWKEVKDEVVFYDNPVSVKLVGVFDVLYELDDGYGVLDWKTGKSSLAGYEKQLWFYAKILDLLGLDPRSGVLVKISDVGEITDVIVIEFSERGLREIEDQIDAAVMDVLINIQDGRLDEYLRYYNIEK